MNETEARYEQARTLYGDGEISAEEARAAGVTDAELVELDRQRLELAAEDDERPSAERR